MNVLVFRIKAELCLHVVKQAVNNYVNVAMTWAAIQVGLPNWFSLFFVYT